MRQEQRGGELALSKAPNLPADAHGARWWQALTDLDRVLTTAQAIHLLLTQHGEVLVRVGMELVLDQQARQIVEWGRDWYVDHGRREWFRQVVRDKTQHVLEKGKASGLAPSKDGGSAKPTLAPAADAPPQEADIDQAFRSVLERHRERFEDLQSKYEQAKRQLDEGEAQALKLNDRERCEALTEAPSSLRLKASASTPAFFKQEPSKLAGYRSSQRALESSVDQPGVNVGGHGVQTRPQFRSVTADMHRSQALHTPLQTCPIARSVTADNASVPSPVCSRSDMKEQRACAPPRSVTADNSSVPSPVRNRSEARDQRIQTRSPPRSVTAEKPRAQRQRSSASPGVSHGATATVSASSNLSDDSSAWRRNSRSSSMATPSQASPRAQRQSVQRMACTAPTTCGGGWRPGPTQRKESKDLASCNEGGGPTLLPDLSGTAFVNRLIKPPSAASAGCLKGLPDKQDSTQAHGNLFAYRLGS